MRFEVFSSLLFAVLFLKIFILKDEAICTQWSDFVYK